MRFLHTSDWHLGRTLHGVDLLDAQRAVLGQLIELVRNPPDGVAVDAVLVAGDIYDRAVPPVEAVALFAETLSSLTAHTTVIVTAGNHDSAIRLGFGAQLFTDRLKVRTELASVGEPVLIDDVAIYPLPYLDPDAARTVLADPLADDPTPLARSHQAVMSAALRRVHADLATRPAGTRSVVMAHAFVVGGAPSESERSIVVGGVDSVAAETFAGIDYVALGHLHGAQQPKSTGPGVLRYSGSPLRYSFSELNHVKSVSLVDLDAAGGVTITSVPVAQPRAMAELTGELDELLADDHHLDDWVRLTVTDRTRPDRLFDRVKSRYPYLLQVQHIPAGSAPVGVAVSTSVTRTPRELGGDFIGYVTGLDADTAELDLFAAAYESAAETAGA